MEILNKIEIMEAPNITIFFMIFAVASFLIALIMFSNDIELIAVIATILCLLGVIGVGLSYIICENVPTGRYKYEVIIDESYSATELYENYNVVEQRGKIWVIEDKKIDE